MISLKNVILITVCFVIVIALINIGQVLIALIKLNSLPNKQKNIITSIINEIQRSDRCDPAPCFDRLLVNSVEILKKDKPLKVGGLNISFGGVEWFIGTESFSNNEVIQICKKGSLDFKLIHSYWYNLNLFPKIIHICYP